MSLKSTGSLFSLLLFAFGTVSVSAQDNKARIAGWVQSSSGEPLIGITVKLKDTTQGAATNSEGYFELDKLAPKEYMLTISGVGFVSQKQKISLKSGEEKTIHNAFRG